MMFRLTVACVVLVPYKITLLSNGKVVYSELGVVLVPYKITLLSNCNSIIHRFGDVLVPYKITLLSNALSIAETATASFSTL